MACQACLSLRRGDQTRRGQRRTTPLDKPIRRELALNGSLYTVTISTEGVKIVPKGKRTGHEISWETLLSGDAELRRDLNISVDAYRGA